MYYHSIFCWNGVVGFFDFIGLFVYRIQVSVQAAGCWALGTFSTKGQVLREEVRKAGGMRIVLGTRERFAANSRVRDNAEFALSAMR